MARAVSTRCPQVSRVRIVSKMNPHAHRSGAPPTFGTGGPQIECDAVEFCRITSRRARGEGLLDTEVPF